MNLETVGVHQAPGYRVPLVYRGADSLEPAGGLSFRLVEVTQGAGIMVLGDQSTPIQAPALICLNETDTPALLHPTDFAARALYFHPRAVNGAFTFESIRGELESTAAQDREWLWAFFHSRVLLLGPTSALQVAHLMESVAQELAEQPDSYWPCRARSYFLELLMLIDRLAMAPSAPLPALGDLSLPPAKRSDVVAYLHSHYGQKLNLAQLSRKFHTNHTTLTREFRALTGESITTYLTRIRLQVAASILRDTTLPIGEVIERVGFHDTTHFGRTFRRAYGLTPTTYRKQHYREYE